MVLLIGKAATLVLLAVTCSAMGSILTTTVSFSDLLERSTITSILGLAATAHILNLLGLAGLLNRGAVLTLFVVTLAIGAGALARRHLAVLVNHPVAAAFSPAATSTLTRAWRQGFRILGLAVVVFGPLLVLASYPPVAFDETLYHLPYARAFVRTGALPFLPQLRVPVFPPLAELLFSVMLLLFDDRSTHLVSFLAAILTALLLVTWGKRESSWRTGALAGALYLGNPIVTQLSSTAYVEPTLTLFVTATLYSVSRYWSDRSTAWLVMAAFFSATAAGVKYLGLFFVPAALILLMLSPREGVRAPKLWASALFCVVVAATLLPVYARIMYFTRNPVFPFLPGVFGSSLWDPAFPPWKFAVRIVGTITLPWNAVFFPAAAGKQAPVSPLVFLLLPLLLCTPGRRSTTRPLLVACAVFAVAIPPDARYLMPILPIVCLALSSALEQASRWAVLPRSLRARQTLFLWICCGILLLPGWLYAVRAVFNRGVPPVGDAERDSFLSRQFPAYRAIEVLNKAFGTRFTVYAVHAENLVYCAEGTLLGDWTGPASFARVLPLAGKPPELFCKLRELGAGYLLVMKGQLDFPLAKADPEFSLRFRRIYEDETSELFALSSADMPCQGADRTKQ